TKRPDEEISTLPSSGGGCCKTAAKRFSSAVAAVYDRRYFVDSAKNGRSLERRYSKNRTRDSVVLQHPQLRRGMVQSRCANENTELPDRPDCSQLEHHDGARHPGH